MTPEPGYQVQEVEKSIYYCQPESEDAYQTAYIPKRENLYTKKRTSLLQILEPIPTRNALPAISTLRVPGALVLVPIRISAMLPLKVNNP